MPVHPKVLLHSYLPFHGTEQPVPYEISLPPTPEEQVDRLSMYVHAPQGRKGRAIDNATETFVDQTRMGTGL